MILLPAKPIMAGIDATILERALSPIVDNSQRYAASTVRIEVTAQRGSVRIRVSDDGPGIPAAELPHIFEPGFSGESPTGHQGSGLGLALSARLIDGSAGTISATSDGQGAVLTVTVPAA